MSLFRSQSNNSITTQTGDDSVIFDYATSVEDNNVDYESETVEMKFGKNPWSILNQNEKKEIKEFLDHMIHVPRMDSFSDTKELIAFIRIKTSQIHSFRAMKAYWWFDNALKNKLTNVFAQIDKNNNTLSKYAEQCSNIIHDKYQSTRNKHEYTEKYIHSNSDDEKSDDSTDYNSLKITKRKNVISDSDESDDSMQCNLIPLKPYDRVSASKHKNICCKCKKMWLNVCGILSANKPSNSRHSQWQDKKDNDDYKLDPSELEKAIRIIADKLGVEPTMPGIDIFASDQNHQEKCWCYITKVDNFFSKQYDCKEFWNTISAWANPPYKWNYLSNTLETYERRKMHGYICGPKYCTGKNQWFHIAKHCCKAYAYLAGRNTNKNMFLPGYCNNKCGHKAPKFDTFVFYFDFREEN